MKHKISCPSTRGADEVCSCMKYYICHYTLIEGEHEYGDKFLVIAKDEKSATEHAKEYLIDFYQAEYQSFDSENQITLHDVSVEFNEVKEIPKSDYQILKKYIGESNQEK